MDGIKIDVTGNIAKVTEKPRRITSGTIGLPVEFTFDDQWDGLSKKAVFRTGHFSIVCELNEEGNTVPWEVLVFPNMWLSVGVYGVNDGGTISIPTIWVNVSVIQPGTVPDGASPAEPTPPVWQRIEDEVNRIGGVVDDVNNQYNVTQEQVEKLGDAIVKTEESQKDIAGRVTVLEENGGTMKVTLDADGRFASKSGVEISAHVAAGGDAVLDEAWGQVMLTKCVQGIVAVFEYLQGDTIVSTEIDDNRNLTTHFTKFATADQIGDISSALDGILDIQETYMNDGIVSTSVGGDDE